MNKVSVDVVIPCRNEEQYIQKCVESLLNQKGNFDLRVYVVDGMSTDATVSILEKVQENYPALEVIENPDKVTPIAMNLGIEKGDGEVVIIFGAHAIAST
ncbi:MAG: glycosyltransferase, partial [Flavobacteriales bacterium]|nr:glycosyltransferase [Flavobacteriales bacterium]